MQLILVTSSKQLFRLLVEAANPEVSPDSAKEIIIA